MAQPCSVSDKKITDKIIILSTQAHPPNNPELGKMLFELVQLAQQRINAQINKKSGTNGPITKATGKAGLRKVTHAKPFKLTKQKSKKNNILCE